MADLPARGTEPADGLARAGEYGSSTWPTAPAVIAKPAIIISQTMVAAGARRRGGTCLASSTSSEVPAALTPRPISAKASTASASPSLRALPAHATAPAASTAPAPSTAMPPTIHGVRRPPTSLPWPMRGRANCTT